MHGVDEGGADRQGVVELIAEPFAAVVLTDELLQALTTLAQRGLEVGKALRDGLFRAVDHCFPPTLTRHIIF
jgi:hypothetical protein